MDRRVKRELMLFGLVVLVFGSVVLVWSLGPQPTVHAANVIPLKPDPLLGKWVMIGDNGTSGNGTVADFRPDGTVVITQHGKVTTGHYRRETGKAWADRRAAAAQAAGVRGGKNFDIALDEFSKPGVEMIEFADEDGNYKDYGGSLLKLDPNRRLLYNPITYVFCRPGDEKRVRRELM
jgi:hypothetical protein